MDAPCGPTRSGLAATKSPFPAATAGKADAPGREKCDASGLGRQRAAPLNHPVGPVLEIGGRDDGRLLLPARANDQALALVVGDAVRWHRLADQPDIARDNGMGANADVAAKDGGMGVNRDVLLDIRVSFHALDRVAVGIELERFCAEGDALVHFHMGADARGFANDDAGAVVDEKVRADLRAGMNVGAGALVGVFRKHARQERYAELVHHMGQALERDDQDARIGEDDFLDAARGGVAMVGGGDVGLDDLAHFRQAAKRLHGELARPRARLGLMGKAQALLDLGGHARGDFPEAPLDEGAHTPAGDGALLEKPREEHVHQVRGQPVDRFLGRQVGAVEMIDAAVSFVRRKEGLLDGVEGHGRAPATFPQEARRVKPDNGTGLRGLHRRVKDGAQGGSRTRTPCGTRPSNVCVYQFHHLSIPTLRRTDK